MGFSTERAIVFILLSGGVTQSSTGGGVSLQELVAKGLIARGIEVFVITNTSDNLGFSFLGEKRFTAHFRSKDGVIFNWFLFDRRRLKKELDRIISLLPEKSLFVTVDPFPPDIAAAFHIRKHLNFDAVITMHHITPSPLFHPFRRGPTRTFISWILSVFAITISKVSQIPVFLDNQRIAGSTGWKLNNLVLETPVTIGALKLRSPGDKRFNACFVGRLNKNKGIRDLLVAWSIVVNMFPQAKLTIVGKDQGNGRYQKLIEKLGLISNVKITGFLSAQDKERVLENSSIFSFPSYEEGWSLAVMESVDNGLLPILYDIPAYDYLESDEIKVPAGNIKAFAHRIIYYMDNNEKRKKLVLSLQANIRKYTPEYVTDVWFNQLENHFDL